MSASRRRPPSGGGWGIIIPLAAATILFFWPSAAWHGCKYGGGSGLSGCGAASEWVWNTQTWIAQAIWWAVLIPAAGLIAHAVHRSAHPKPPPLVPPVKVASPGPLPGRVSASLPPAPQPPLCLHLNAVRVENLINPAGPPWAWLCPIPPQGCGERLDENFGRVVRSCCGTLPGTRHMRNCPQAPEGTP